MRKVITQFDYAPKIKWNSMFGTISICDVNLSLLKCFPGLKTCVKCSLNWFWKDANTEFTGYSEGSEDKQIKIITIRCYPKG